MKRKMINNLLLVFAGCLFIVMPAAGDDDGIFRLLTLNLLFSEPTTAPDSEGRERFDSIADFIERENIDCVLCQEVVGGELAKELGLTETLNSSLDLKSRLGDDYRLSYRLANGIPLVFSVGNAILCKKPVDIKWTVAKTLSFASEITIHGIDIKLRRKIMGSLLDVPHFGKLLLFNVHLCSFCPTAQRQAQINEALQFIETIRAWTRWFYGNIPIIFGGDFNIEDFGVVLPASAELEYNLIMGAGFTDAYADRKPCRFQEDCCEPVDDEPTVEPGCTYAVDNNLFENDPLQTTRIDYFFLRGLMADSAYVVFNRINGPFVSDHSGLVVEFSH